MLRVRDEIFGNRKDRVEYRVLRHSVLGLLSASLQLRVLCLGLFQDGDVGIGVFPEGEEIVVGGERPDAGRIGIRALQVF